MSNNIERFIISLDFENQGFADKVSVYARFDSGENGSTKYTNSASYLADRMSFREILWFQQEFISLTKNYFGREMILSVEGEALLTTQKIETVISINPTAKIDTDEKFSDFISAIEKIGLLSHGRNERLMLAKDTDIAYKTVIRLRKDTPAELLPSLAATVADAFKNRAGCIKNTSNDQYEFSFESDESGYPCLDLGVIKLGESQSFLKYVSSWDWIDEDPDESCDMLDVIARFSRRKGQCMYQTVITFKDGLSDELLAKLRDTAEKAFDNRLGKAINISNNPNQCVFGGGEDLHLCLHDSNYNLNIAENFRDYVKEWDWFDSENPSENCSVLEAWAKFEKMKSKGNPRRS